MVDDLFVFMLPCLFCMSDGRVLKSVGPQRFFQIALPPDVFLRKEVALSRTRGTFRLHVTIFITIQTPKGEKSPEASDTTFKLTMEFHPPALVILTPRNRGISTDKNVKCGYLFSGGVAVVDYQIQRNSQDLQSREESIPYVQYYR